MKKILAVVVAATLGLGLFAGCNKKQSGDEDVKAELIQFEEPKEGQPIATMTIKDFGDIRIMFFPEEAPKAVENFLTHAKNGYYEGVYFHRVINDFMIQGGDPTATGKAGLSIWNKPFEDEFSNNLYNFRGALSMANSGINTNGSQFFIVQNSSVSQADIDSVLSSNKTNGDGRTTYDKSVMEKYIEVGGTPHLDKKHTVFGQVIEGMEVVDAIAKTPASQDGKPETPVIIEKIVVEE